MNCNTLQSSNMFCLHTVELRNYMGTLLSFTSLTCWMIEVIRDLWMCLFLHYLVTQNILEAVIMNNRTIIHLAICKNKVNWRWALFSCILNCEQYCRLTVLIISLFVQSPGQTVLSGQGHKWVLLAAFQITSPRSYGHIQLFKILKKCLHDIILSQHND